MEEKVFVYSMHNFHSMEMILMDDYCSARKDDGIFRDEAKIIRIFAPFVLLFSSLKHLGSVIKGNGLFQRAFQFDLEQGDDKD